MIRLTLVLLACIGITMVVAGRDVDVAMGSDDPDMDVAQGNIDPTELSQPNRLALDDEAGAIRRALNVAAPDIVTDPVVQPASLGTLLENNAGSHFVTGNRVNVRSGPSTANSVVDQVVRDQRVDVLDETADGWMRILILDTGDEAYIFGRFLEPVNG